MSQVPGPFAPGLPPTLTGLNDLLALLTGTISEANRQALAFRLEPFPLAAATYCGFETHLRPPYPWLDCAFNLSSAGLYRLAHVTRLWPNISQFCTLWGESGQPPYSDAACVWLEFDAHAVSELPAIFIALREDTDYNPQRSFHWLCQEALAVLRGKPLPAMLAANLSRCRATMPTNIDLIQIGLMLSRQIEAVRLCGFRFQASDVLPFLHHIGWPGDKRSVAQVLDAYASFADYLCLHLDVGTVIYPTLGIELLYAYGSGPDGDPWRSQPQFEPRWHSLFERLVADNYCAVEMRDALLRWPRRSEYKLPLIERLLAAITTSPQLAADGTIVQGLQHIKFSLKLGHPTLAKCYFGVRYEATPL